MKTLETNDLGENLFVIALNKTLALKELIFEKLNSLSTTGPVLTRLLVFLKFKFEILLQKFFIYQKSVTITGAIKQNQCVRTPVCVIAFKMK